VRGWEGDIGDDGTVTIRHRIRGSDAGISVVTANADFNGGTGFGTTTIQVG